MLREHVYESLRGRILSCDLPPGAELHEQALAADFSVSKSPVREALLRLERESLVQVTPRQGYRVSPVSLTDARDLFGLRRVLESACAAAAARSAPDEVLAGFDRYRLFDATAGIDAFIEYNRGFHLALAEASGNRRLAAVTRDSIEQMDRLVVISIGHVRGRDPSRLVGEHAAIIDAIQGRDERRASRLVAEHVERAERRVLSALAHSAVRG